MTRSSNATLEPTRAVPLASFSTLAVGGPAAWFARATSSNDVARAHAWAGDHGVPLFVLGGGSNVVVADEGLDALVLRVAIRGIDVTRSGHRTLVTAGAGETWDELVAQIVSRGLAGVECLSGIPGTVGGTPIQNVGAYGQEVSRVVRSVSAFDRQTGRMVTLAGSECGFAYRHSRFKGDDGSRFVICAVTFDLAEGRPTVTYPDVVEHLRRSGIDSPSLAQVRDAVLTIRRRKGMVVHAADPDSMSVGSFFVNPVVTRATFDRLARPGEAIPHFVMENGDVKIPAAWLIERSGFPRGRAAGSVGLSAKHPLAVINRGGATAREVVRFAVQVKQAVADRFGISLRAEPAFVGFGADPDTALLAA